MSLHVVLNPDARGVERDRILRHLARGFAGMNYHLCDELSRPHLRNGAGRNPEIGIAGAAGGAIIVAGGDGTLSRVINAVGPFGPCVGVLPGGTAHDFASLLGIPHDVGPACEVIRAGHTRAVDLVSVNGKLFVTCGGVGLPAAVAALANRWKAPGSPARALCRRLGCALYALAAAAALCRRRPCPCRIECEGTVRFADSLALVVSNQARFGGRFRVSPAASNQDGVLDLWAVERPHSCAGALRILLAALAGRADRLPGARSLRGREAAVVCGSETSFMGDGELLAEGRRFTVRVLPGALRVFAPARRAGA
jgi:YegS/Rv2252/BmrU family lipid kinase